MIILCLWCLAAQELREIQALDVANWAQQLQRERQRSLELSLQVEDLQQRSHGVGYVLVFIVTVVVGFLG